MNVPQLRFSGFDGEWEKTSIAEATSRIGDGIHSTPKYNEVGKISFINGNNLQNEKIVVNGSTKRIDEVEFKKHNLHLNLTSILYSINGTIGNLAFYNNEKVLLGKSAAYMNVDVESYNKYFISLILKSSKVKKHFLGELTGTTIRNLSLKTIRETSFYSPTLLEQEKIAGFFALQNQKIEKQQEKVEKLERFKKGMMQKIFSQELRFKDEDCGEFAEWEENLIGKFIVDHIEKTTVNNQYPVLTSSRKGLVFQKDHFKNRQVTTDENVGYHIIPRDYFTYRSRSDDGRFFFNRNTIIDKGIVSYFYPVFNVTNIHPDYFWIYINNYLAKEILIEIVGTSQLVLSLNKFKKLKIMTPELKEQKKIGNYFSKLELKIEKEKEKLMVLEEQKKGFMWGMFV